MRIGLDFDNTIIRYDAVFQAAAQTRGLLDPSFSGNKQAVRDEIRLRPDGELEWQALQGYVYGKGISGAEPFPGLDEFLKRARAEQHEIVIVSHKTEYGHFDPDKVNLREAARHWMASRGFFEKAGFGILEENVHFATTRLEKLNKIAALECDVFIDDLEEVLDDPAFPAAVRPILFSERAGSEGRSYLVCPTWPAIEEAVFHESR